MSCALRSFLRCYFVVSVVCAFLVGCAAGDGRATADAAVVTLPRRVLATPTLVLDGAIDADPVDERLCGA